MANWMRELKKNIVTVEDLQDAIQSPVLHKKELEQIIQLHPMSVTRYYMSLINKNDPQDPIKKMIIPTIYELDQDGSYDTSGEAKNTVAPGLQHKYANTALLQVTNQCAAYCRYCFRKRSVGYPDPDLGPIIKDAANYISRHLEINNVLVSGGDPLILPAKNIESILKKLYAIKHLDYVRIGSRMPVVFPQRISDDRELLTLLATYAKKDKRLYLVTHFNHPREITPLAIKAIKRLIQAGIIIDNQMVLIRNVNDQPGIIATLMKSLVRYGVNPYYVFQCRPVKRVKKNFQISLLEGIRIIENAKKLMDGHAKRFKYAMSHISGKIEIIGQMDDRIILKYHQARDRQDLGKVFSIPADPALTWYDTFEMIGSYR